MPTPFPYPPPRWTALWRHKGFQVVYAARDGLGIWRGYANHTEAVESPYRHGSIYDIRTGREVTAEAEEAISQ